MLLWIISCCGPPFDEDICCDKFDADWLHLHVKGRKRSKFALSLLLLVTEVDAVSDLGISSQKRHRNRMNNVKILCTHEASGCVVVRLVKEFLFFLILEEICPSAVIGLELLRWDHTCSTAHFDAPKGVSTVRSNFESILTTRAMSDRCSCSDTIFHNWGAFLTYVICLTPCSSWPCLS